MKHKQSTQRGRYREARELLDAIGNIPDPELLLKRQTAVRGAENAQAREFYPSRVYVPIKVRRKGRIND